MKKTIDYLLIQSREADELQRLVKENIETWGWELYGTPFTGCRHFTGCQHFEITHVLYQAMVKYSEDGNG